MMFRQKRGLKVTVLAVLALALVALPLVANAAEPVNGITNPKDGATVKGSVDVTGYANAPAFWKWQLDLLPGGSADAAIFLAVGETAGNFSFTLDTTGLPNGEHALRLRVVTTDGNYQEFTNKFTVANGAATPAAAAPTAPAAAAATTETATAEKAETPATQAAEKAAAAGAPTAPANGITSPKDGSTVKGSVDVTGYANAPAFWKWQLDLLPGLSADAAIFLAVGETAGNFSYTLDTTGLPNGEHALRLRVVTTDGNYQEFTNKFTVANGGAAPAAAAAATGPATVAVTQNAQLGTFVADAQGRSLYHFTKDTLNTSNCYGTCEQNWPPLLTKGAPIAGKGVDAALLGTTTRTDGTSQVTYNGWPLYHFIKDQKPGDVNGQKLLGLWFVLSPKGEPIGAPAAAETTTETAAAEKAETPATAKAEAVNGIAVPKAGATVSGSVEVLGYASDPNFAKWQLDLLPGGSADAAIFLAVGETPGEFSYTLDTTAFPNGEQALRLRIVRSDSNYSEFVTKFVIANK